MIRRQCENMIKRNVYHNYNHYSNKYLAKSKNCKNNRTRFTSFGDIINRNKNIVHQKYISKGNCIITISVQDHNSQTAG